MLLTISVAQGIRDGSVTAVFRRWDAPRVRVGGTQRTGAGVIRFTSVDRIDDESLTDADARGAGMASLAALRAANQRGRGADLYRIGVAFDRPDERVALRAASPSAVEIAEIAATLDRMDRGRRTGPWTRTILRLIEANPAVRAPDLAASLGRETAVQAGRAQAQGARAHPQPGRWLRVVGAWPSVPGRRDRPVGRTSSGRGARHRST